MASAQPGDTRAGGSGALPRNDPVQRGGETASSPRHHHQSVFDHLMSGKPSCPKHAANLDFRAPELAQEHGTLHACLKRMKKLKKDDSKTVHVCFSVPRAVHLGWSVEKCSNLGRVLKKRGKHAFNDHGTKTEEASKTLRVISCSSETAHSSTCIRSCSAIVSFSTSSVGYTVMQRTGEVHQGQPIAFKRCRDTIVLPGHSDHSWQSMHSPPLWGHLSRLEREIPPLSGQKRRNRGKVIYLSCDVSRAARKPANTTRSGTFHHQD